jgi:hypothetical protein
VLEVQERFTCEEEMGLAERPVGTVGAVVSGATAGAIEIESVALPVPAPLVAEMPELTAPDADGVPEMTPVAVFTERPAGRFVAP